MNADEALAGVRRQIDALDDAIHDLIMRRTELVNQVRELKRGSRVKIRPSREAEIVCRLVDRHRGPFPKRELTAIWRQLINATLAFEGPFAIAVYMPDDSVGYWDVARDHFGQYTPMTRHASVRSVIEAVHRQDSTVGILPLPQQDDDDPWWRHIVTNQPDAPRIIARLPFAGPSNGLGGRLEALAVCPVDISPTGRDRSLFAVDMDRHLGLTQFAAALRTAGLAPLSSAMWREDQRPHAWLYLAEVDGFLVGDDRRLTVLREHLGKAVNRIVPLGGYARPLTAEDLAGPAPAAANGGTP